MSGYDNYPNYVDTYDYLKQSAKGFAPAMICVACNGGIQGKEVNENIPETADEIADEVYKAYQAGASMVHVHARSRNKLWHGAKTVEEWYEVFQKIRQRCPDIIINATTGGSAGMTDQERLSSLDAGPEVASLNLTPDMSRVKIKPRPAPLMHPHEGFDIDECWAISYGAVSGFAMEMKKRGIKPEMETYHTGGIWVIRHLIEQKIVEPPYYIQTVMGYQTGSYPTIENTIHLLREFPAQTFWLCSGLGVQQLPLTTFALLQGGHVRVGLEDNVYYRKGEKATGNAQFVERVVRIANELNRPIATPQQARAMLGLSETPTQYP